MNSVAATGGLALRNEPRRSALFEAHPVTPTAPSSLRGSFLPSWRPRRRTPDAGPARPSDAHRVAPPPPPPDAPSGAGPISRRPKTTDADTTEDATGEQLPLALDDSVGLAELAVLSGLDEAPESGASAP